MFRDHILELVIILAGMVEEQHNNSWDTLLLEIFYLLLRKETPAELLEAYARVMSSYHALL
jgi:Timeless protein